MKTTVKYFQLCRAVAELEHRSIGNATKLILQNKTKFVRDVHISGTHGNKIATADFEASVLELISSMNAKHSARRCDCGEIATHKASDNSDICEKCWRLSQTDWHAMTDRDNREFHYASRKYLALATNFICGTGRMTPAWRSTT